MRSVIGFMGVNLMRHLPNRISIGQGDSDFCRLFIMIIYPIIILLAINLVMPIALVLLRIIHYLNHLHRSGGQNHKNPPPEPLTIPFLLIPTLQV